MSLDDICTDVGTKLAKAESEGKFTLLEDDVDSKIRITSKAYRKMAAAAMAAAGIPFEKDGKVFAGRAPTA